MFGRQGYGSSVGWMTAARQFTTAFAPFVFAVMMAELGVPISLAALMALGACGVAVFGIVAWIAAQRPSA